MTRIESLGSVWHINATSYLRMPLDEAPRSPAEWGDEHAGGLQDLVWHPHYGWNIFEEPMVSPRGTIFVQRCLVIYTSEDRSRFVRAPLETEVVVS